MQNAPRHVLAAVFAVGVFAASLLAAWQVLSAANFFYGIHYDILNIDRAVAIYAPQNRYPAKRRFLRTTKAERVRIFSRIVHGINENGDGLRQIAYHSPAGRRLGTFLTDAEAVHLEDVARLVSVLRFWALVLAGLGGAALAALLFRRDEPPRVRGAVGMVGGIIGAVTVFVLIAGPTAVFYRLHLMVFPGDHQWFFYYQESLMTTIMLAPALFGWIAAELVVLGLVFFGVIVHLVRRLGARFAAH